MKKKSKHSDASTNRQMEKLERMLFAHTRDTQARHIQVERVLAEAFKKAKKKNDKVLLGSILSMTVHLYESAGWTRRALAILIEQENRSPKDLDAQYRIARFHFSHGGDPQMALNKAEKIKLPQKPGELDYDSYFNALALKGQSQLALGKDRRAISTMKEMAAFTTRYSDKTIFFWDMLFVSAMVQKKLGLRHCKNYLVAIDQVDQVSHDQAETKRLLQHVNGLLRR